MNTPFNALPPYFGGKRRLLPWIFNHLDTILPKSDWSNRVFLDAFAGGGSVSLYAKALGFKALLTNDRSARSQIVFQALLLNQSQYLQANDLLWLTQPLPVEVTGFIQSHFVPHVLSTRHAQALDRVWYWAHQYKDPIKQNLSLLLLWHLIHEFVCMPTSINTSNRPYAETLDGLRDWQELNPKRFTDNSFPRLLKPRWSVLESLRKRINAGVFGGNQVFCHQQEAAAFLQAQSGDIAYLDPPYPGSLSYESSLKTLDTILFGRDYAPLPCSAFSKEVSALRPLLESARHIPIWLLSYGDHLIDLPGLCALVQDLVPNRTVHGAERSYRHLAHVSKTQARKELLVLAY